MSNSNFHGLGKRVILLGLLLLVLSLGLAGYQAYDTLGWIRTSAEVVKNDASSQMSAGLSTRGASTTYRPTLRYADVQGRVHTVQSATGSTQFDFDEGTHVPIRYDPNQPRRMRIATFSADWGIPLIGAGIGLAVLLLGRWLRGE